jgi:hypothetical protein
VSALHHEAATPLIADRMARSRLMRLRCARGRSAVRPAASEDLAEPASGEIRYLTWRPEPFGRDSRPMAVDRRNGISEFSKGLARGRGHGGGVKVGSGASEPRQR